MVAASQSLSFLGRERLGALNDGGQIDSEYVRDLCELGNGERVQVRVLESSHERRARDSAFLRSVRDRYVLTGELVIDYPSHCFYILRDVHNRHSTAHLGIVKTTRRPFGQSDSEFLCL